MAYGKAPGLPPLVLASQSPRRAELLARLGLPFEVRPAHLDEGGLAHLPPLQMARALAEAKAQAVRAEGRWVLAADTVVALGGRALGKPRDLEENRAFLKRLSGRTHTVYTAFAIVQPGGRLHSEVAEAQVTFRQLFPWELEWYLQSGEGLDKAGGYGAQGRGMVFLKSLQGDFYTVMGLPVSRVWQCLIELGYFSGGR
ncbi:septum formation protein Maf [Meiothermus sp. QL-1]|uniref:Maf family protein n=1 Tax=Meiothermus sp. QL-1 TaxID=2058095 RepID=UPI000E0BE85A|nr:Maf family protein [Meiothermus sp. QL-1]RDI96518.1 septum formation protein Maf [Meiothermus sp. QL-1]